jgi:hypothetical protein
MWRDMLAPADIACTFSYTCHVLISHPPLAAVEAFLEQVVGGEVESCRAGALWVCGRPYEHCICRQTASKQDV